MKELNEILLCILNDSVYKIIISNPYSKQEEYNRIVVEKKDNYFQISKYTVKQVFHENTSSQNIFTSLVSLINGRFKQLNAWSATKEHILLISKKGACAYKTKCCSNAAKIQNTEHNRTKNYILEQGKAIAPLVDMGIFTPDGKVIRPMYNKYKQINRFIEIIDDEIGKCGLKEINIIDFGCGKSYLTFILYYYLTEVVKIKANIIGLDLKEDVINKCNEAAKKYGYDGLRFELGDINGYKAPFNIDMVITLHACDTATDYALYNAICWNAKYIFSVPCCQHELNDQIKSDGLSIISRYGIIKERFSALATDAIRGNLLEFSGYKTQILEFIDLDHTPKNILIRAVKRPATSNRVKENAISEINSLIKEFNFNPTLYKLLIK